MKAGKGEPESGIFHTKGGHTSQNTIRNIWKRLLKKAGLEDQRLHNIRHTYLFDLYGVEQKYRASQVLNNNSTVMSEYEVDEIASIENFEDEEEYPSVVRKIYYPELPDLSEYEKMIDWDDVSDPEVPSEFEKHLYNSSDNLYLNAF